MSKLGENGWQNDSLRKVFLFGWKSILKIEGFFLETESSLLKRNASSFQKPLLKIHPVTVISRKLDENPQTLQKTWWFLQYFLVMILVVLILKIKLNPPHPLTCSQLNRILKIWTQCAFWLFLAPSKEKKLGPGEDIASCAFKLVNKNNRALKKRPLYMYLPQLLINRSLKIMPLSIPCALSLWLLASLSGLMQANFAALRKYEMFLLASDGEIPLKRRV